MTPTLFLLIGLAVVVMAFWLFHSEPNKRVWIQQAEEFESEASDCALSGSLVKLSRACDLLIKAEKSWVLAGEFRRAALAARRVAGLKDRLGDFWDSRADAARGLQ
jgi:hypothetical protein